MSAKLSRMTAADEAVDESPSSAETYPNDFTRSQVGMGATPGPADRLVSRHHGARNVGVHVRGDPDRAGRAVRAKPRQP